ncbi:MAG: amidohydrolase [Bacteroidetes bacterium]|nr:MAG: amidohydrolase [Bacteroidota bacterium]
MAQVENTTDVIVLPEMFTTGFTNSSSEMAEKMAGKTHQWMQSQAQKLNSVVCGSIIIDVDGEYYNRFLWVEPDGNTIHYDKRHLFRMANENNYYAAGNNQININYKGWKIRPLVCYDLRFPVWARNTVNKNQFDYDILLYVANWPQARVSVWDTLLKARAMENYAYSIGVNRVGKDENGIVYNGHSAVYGPKGEEFCMLEDAEQVSTIKLEKQPLDDFREKIPIYLDADNFDLNID